MAIKPVKMFTNAMVGAPVLNGTAGSLIALLDACLVNGFNLVSLTSLSIVDGVLTGEKAGHGFIVDQVVATTANEPILNGEWIITSATSNTFSAAATGLANTNGSGAITAKSAAAGWEKIGAGNKAAYRSTAPESTLCWLRVDDSGTTSARVRGCESMTDIDIFSGGFPTDTQANGGGYWIKSLTATATSRAWILVADKSAFYFSRGQGDGYYQLDGFGDFQSEKPGDSYSCFLQYLNDASPYGWMGTALAGFQYSDANNSKIVAARSFTQMGSAKQLLCCYSGHVGIWSGSAAGFQYPSPLTNGLVLSPVMAREFVGYIRCLAFPGIYATPQANPLVHGDKVGPLSALPGRKLVAISIGVEYGEGRMFIDIVGPWR